MAVHALVHTQGVVLGNKYIPLELAYIDVTGYEIYFSITSPLTYFEAKRLYPHCRPDAFMSTRSGVPYPAALQFLRQRYETLVLLFGDDVRFGHKGPTYQKEILLRAGLDDRLVNVEAFGVPNLKRLYLQHPMRRCSLHSARLVWNVLHQQQVLAFSQQETFGQIQQI